MSRTAKQVNRACKSAMGRKTSIVAQIVRYVKVSQRQTGSWDVVLQKRIDGDTYESACPYSKEWLFHGSSRRRFKQKVRRERCLTFDPHKRRSSCGKEAARLRVVCVVWKRVRRCLRVLAGFRSQPLHLSTINKSKSKGAPGGRARSSDLQILRNSRRVFGRS